MDEDDKRALEGYHRYWIGALRYVFEWPDDQAQLLADAMHADSVQSRWGVLYLHEIAAWWVVQWAFEERLLERHSAELASLGIKTGPRLQEVLAHLIQTSSGWPDETPLKWPLARAELERFLQQFGERIPPPPTRERLMEVVAQFGPRKAKGDLTD